MTAIVESLFGVNPERYKEQQDAALQQEALAYAQLNPMQRAEANIYAGARQLGGGIGRMLGGEDPGMRRVTEQDQIIRSIDLNDPETYGPAAQRAYQMGHTELAQKILLGADTAYQRQEATRQRAAQMQTRQQTQAAQQLIPRLMTPGQESQMMVDAEGGSYMQEAKAAGIDQNTLRQLMATPAGRAELADYLKLQEATRGKRTTIAEGGTVIEEDPFTGAVRKVATGAVKPVTPLALGSDFNRLAREVAFGVPHENLTREQVTEINRRVDAEKSKNAASSAPKISVDLKDPTAVAKARLEVMTKWEGVLKSGGDVELSNRYNALQSSVAQANSGNAVADGATIYNLAKMYDPSGAVQEGDKKTVVGNPSVPQRVQLFLQQLSVGGSFTPEQRKNMLKIADELVEQRENALKRQARNYTDIVKNFGGNTEDIYNPYTRAARPTTLADVITPLPAASAAKPQAPMPAPQPAPAPQLQAPAPQPQAPAPMAAPVAAVRPQPAPPFTPAATGLFSGQLPAPQPAPAPRFAPVAVQPKPDVVPAMPPGQGAAAPQLIPDNVDWRASGFVIYTNPDGKKVTIGKANTQAEVFKLIKKHEAKTK